MNDVSRGLVLQTLTESFHNDKKYYGPEGGLHSAVLIDTCNDLGFETLKQIVIAHMAQFYSMDFKFYSLVGK